MTIRPLGFSTGSLSPGNARQALAMLSRHATTAIELSALRANELDEVLEVVTTSDWSAFYYVSFHAPSKFNGITEAEVLRKLKPIIDRRWPIIVHPDVITDWATWHKLGAFVTIENMDGRKPNGRTVEELSPIFAKLPQAKFCFDIGHAAQIDPSMKLAGELIDAFGDRLIEVHLSVVDDAFSHQPLTMDSIKHFTPVLKRLVGSAAIILETPADEMTMADQLHLVSIMMT
ncbi:MAG TPA: hypothetical protein PLN21_10425 [Gemmatales bacterium]|nr:hypothetical protein [Gemmatales bacterium]